MTDPHDQLVHDQGRLLLENARLERRLAKSERQLALLVAQCAKVGLTLADAIETLRQHVGHKP
jgi:hypothetical protein